MATIIKNVTQLQAINSNLSENYILDNDIDCSSINPFSPLAISGTPFSGTLNGHGYRIYSLTINSADATGLFGYVTGTIERVYLSGSINTAGESCSFVDNLDGGTVKNCKSDCSIVSGGDFESEGIVQDGGGTVQSCLFTGTIEVGESGLYSGVSGVGITATGSFYDKTLNPDGQDEAERGKTTLDLKTYPNAIYNSWDTSIWSFENGQYPSLIQGEVESSDAGFTPDFSMGCGNEWEW